jgi:hypothetical protein
VSGKKVSREPTGGRSVSAARFEPAGPSSAWGVARSRPQISKEGSARSAGIRAPVVFGLRNPVRSIG